MRDARRRYAVHVRRRVALLGAQRVGGAPARVDAAVLEARDSETRRRADGARRARA